MCCGNGALRPETGEALAGIGNWQAINVRPPSQSLLRPQEAFERMAVSCGGQSNKYSLWLSRPV